MEPIRDKVHRNFGGQCHPGDIAPYTFVPGSKERVRKLASCWEQVRQVADHYEFLVMTGVYRGIRMTACSTGIGGMSVSTAVEELANLGATTLLRIGVTSPLKDELKLGELVIAKGAVRWDGTSHDYVRPEYPAIAHFELVMAAIAAAEHLQLPYKVGIIGDFASLGSQRRDGFRHFLTDRTAPWRQALYDLGVLDGTGESATLFVQASIYGLRAGAISINSADQQRHLWDEKADDNVVAVGLETMRVLVQWDAHKAKRSVAHMTPEIPAIPL